MYDIERLVIINSINKLLIYLFELKRNINIIIFVNSILIIYKQRFINKYHVRFFL